MMRQRGQDSPGRPASYEDEKVYGSIPQGFAHQEADTILRTRLWAIPGPSGRWPRQECPASGGKLTVHLHVDQDCLGC